MRTYDDIYTDYLNWLAEKTGNNYYKPENFFRGKDEKTAKSFLYKSILKLCYDKTNGLYYFTKFIIGDLLDIGYPSAFRYNSILRKWDKLVKSNKRLAIMCARGHGKKIADSTPVLTTKGWTTHGKLTIGDKVYGINGDAVEILNTNKKSILDYIVEFGDGESIRCHENHEWTLYDITKRKNPVTIETKDLIGNIKTYKDNRHRFSLPNIKPIEFRKKELPIDPYYLGLWLGDGCNTSTTITHSKNDIESINSVPYDISSQWSHKVTEVITTSFAQNDILQNFQRLDLIKNKHIPEIYKYSSIEQRLELLAGLIDSDGSVSSSKKSNRIRFVNTNKKIIDGCVEILRSLGLRPYITAQYPKKGHLCNGHLIQGKQIAYTINFVSNINIPTRLPRKKVKTVKLNRIAVTDVRYEPNGEKGNCIMVDSDDGLYLVGKHLVPTHNSVFFSEMLNIYDMFLFPYRRIIVESSNQEQANRIVGEITKIVRANEWLKSKLESSRAEKLVYNGGYLIGKGFGSEILGEHVDRIVIDDILRSDNKLTDREIEDFIDMDLSPMLINRRGQMILVGCVNENTLVLTKEGFTKIKKLKTTQEKLEPFNKPIYGINGFNVATDIFDNGIKDTKKIKLKYGYELESTLNHPLLILDTNGNLVWKKTKELKLGDTVAIQYNQNIFGDDDSLPKVNMERSHKEHNCKRVTNDFAYLMGLYLAEGSHDKNNSITITNAKKGKFLLSNSMKMNFIDKRKDDTHYTYNSRYLIEQMKKLGFKFDVSYKKEFPDKILGWKKELISAFIRGYADGDGCVSRNTVKFTSTSKSILKTLQVLLLNYGILSSLTEYDGRNINRNSGYPVKRVRYDLNILRESVKTYYNEIGFSIPRKQKKLEKFASLSTSGKSIPHMYGLLYEGLKSVHKKTNIKRHHHIYGNHKSHPNYRISVDKLNFYISELKRERCDKKILDKLERFSNSNLYFLDIIDIKKSKSRTMDFIIPKTHSFVSNGIISHNTPKSESDIFKEIERRVKQGSTWRLYKFPAIVDYDNKIVQCPDRFTWEMLMNERLGMGSLKFAREFQLETFSRDTSLFPDTIIKPAKKKGRDMYLLNKLDKRGSEWIIVGGVDTARSGSVSADFTVVTILAYNTITQAKQIIYMWRKKGLKTTEQAKHIADISKRFGNPMFVVEQNNIGQDMIDELVDKWNVYVEPFITGGRGQKKEELIRFLVSSFEHEQIIIPQGDMATIRQMAVLEDELSKFCVTTTPAGNEKFEGVGAHDDCLPPDELVQTIEGLKPIADIKVGDKVLTHKGRYRKVLRVGNRPETKIVEITGTGKIPIRVTDNHNILVYSKKLDYKTRKNTTYYTFPEWKNYKHMKKYKHLGTAFPINREVHNISKIDLIKYAPSTYKSENDKLVAYTYGGGRLNPNQNIIDRHINLDYDFCQILGYYMAEGSTGEHNVTFSSHIREKNIREFSTSFFKKLGMNVCESITNNGVQTSFGNMVFRNFFNSFGHKENKKLPANYVFLPPDKQLKIVIGWLLGDGSFRNGKIKAVTISRELANQMYIFLSRNNIICSLKRQKGQNGGKTQYVISLSFHESKKIIEKTDKKFWEEKGIFIKNIKQNQTMIKRNNNHIIGQIRSIVEHKYNGLVYNLEVEDDNSYVTENTIVHNCVMSLALANKGTQIGGVPFAITREGGNTNDPYSALFQARGGSKHESDLVRRIRMGLIK